MGGISRDINTPEVEYAAKRLKELGVSFNNKPESKYSQEDLDKRKKELNLLPWYITLLHSILYSSHCRLSDADCARLNSLVGIRLIQL
jgi:hypothetical protein